MLTTRDAFALLTRLRDGAPLTVLLPILGFTDSVRIGGREIRRLGLPSAPAVVRLAARGPLRALLCEWDDGAPDRDAVLRAARHLARERATLCWVILARWRAGRGLTICAPAIGETSATAALHVDLAQVRPSDAEVVAALAADVRGPEMAVHLQWRGALGREAIGHRFYKDLVRTIDHLAETADGRASAADRGPGARTARRPDAGRCTVPPRGRGGVWHAPSRGHAIAAREGAHRRPPVDRPG